MVGMGLPTIVMGLLAAVMPLPQAAALMVLPSFVTNIWQVWRGPSLMPLLLRLWPLLLGICAGTWLGAGLLTSGGKLATVALGVALMLYAVLGLATWRFAVRSRHEPWLSAIAGVTTGVVTAATGIYVIPAGPYLQAIGLERDELVQALGLSFTVSTVALGAILARDGTLEIVIAGASALAIVPALAGMSFGQWLRARVDPERFRIYFLVALLMVGIHLIVRGVL
jgi:uncharacterized membrane protein YfcA